MTKSYKIINGPDSTGPNCAVLDRSPVYNNSGDLLCNHGRGHEFIENLCCLCGCPETDSDFDRCDSWITNLASEIQTLDSDLQVEINLIIRQPIPSIQRLFALRKLGASIAWQPKGKAKFSSVLDEFQKIFS